MSGALFNELGTDWVEVVSFTVPGRPQQRGSKVVHVPVDKNDKVYRSKKTGRIVTHAKDDNEERSGPWMKAVQAAVVGPWAARPLITGPVAMSVVFCFARPKKHYGTGRNLERLRDDAPQFHAGTPDLDKLTRCLKDALTDHVWVDDKQVCEYLSPYARRWVSQWDAERTHVRIYTPAREAVEPDDF